MRERWGSGVYVCVYPPTRALTHSLTHSLMVSATGNKIEDIQLPGYRHRLQRGVCVERERESLWVGGTAVACMVMVMVMVMMMLLLMLVMMMVMEISVSAKI